MAEVFPQPKIFTFMKLKQLTVKRWGREYRCYNSIIKHLKLSVNEIFRFRKAVREGKIRFFREVPFVDDFEHRFFHEGDVRKVIDAYRSRKKEHREQKVCKKNATKVWINKRRETIFENMLKKQEEVIAKSIEEKPLEDVVEEESKEEQELEIVEENKHVEETKIGHWLGIYEKMLNGESVSDEMVSFH